MVAVWITYGCSLDYLWLQPGSQMVKGRLADLDVGLDDADRLCLSLLNEDNPPEEVAVCIEQQALSGRWVGAEARSCTATELLELLQHSIDESNCFHHLSIDEHRRISHSLQGGHCLVKVHISVATGQGGEDRLANMGDAGLLCEVPHECDLHRKVWIDVCVHPSCTICGHHGENVAQG